MSKVLERILNDLPPEAEEVGEPDQNLVAVASAIVEVLRRYFRCRVEGLDWIPQGTALLVGNHNAGITFFEPFFLAADWYYATGELMAYLAHDTVLKMPGLGPVLMQLGAVRACHEAADRALSQGRKVVVFPGGAHEAFRPYTDRHRVDFGGHTGYVRLALRHQVPVVPVLSVGGHETFMVLSRGERLARWLGARRYLRSQTWPIYLGLPWGLGFGPLFHLPLPSKTVVEVGEPMILEGYGPDDADDPDKVAEVARLVEGRLQEMMDRHAANRRLPIIG